MAKGKIGVTGGFSPGFVEPTEEFIKKEIAMGQNGVISDACRARFFSHLDDCFVLFGGSRIAQLGGSLGRDSKLIKTFEDGAEVWRMSRGQY